MSAKFKCLIVQETEAALLVRQEIPNRTPVEEWIPRSQCEHISKQPAVNQSAIPATITAKSWILEKKGLTENA